MEYELTAVADGEAEETVRFKTDYEFVTLNVRRFGARGDGKHDDTVAIQAAVSSCPEHGSRTVCNKENRRSKGSFFQNKTKKEWRIL